MFVERKTWTRGKSRAEEEKEFVGGLYLGLAMEVALSFIRASTRPAEPGCCDSEPVGGSAVLPLRLTVLWASGEPDLLVNKTRTWPNYGVVDLL